MTDERPSSRDFEVYLVLSIIHNSRLRDYVQSALTPEVFTEFDCQYIYETVSTLHRKKKKITFFGVFETIRRDTKLSTEKAEAICGLLAPYAKVGSDLSAIDSMTDGVLPIIEEKVKKRIVEMALIKSVDMFENESTDQVIDLWAQVGRQSIYQVPDRVSVWDAIEKYDGDISKTIGYRLGIPTGICGLDASQHVEYLDQKLFYRGGARGHLGIVLADSNVGKSTFMLNLALYQVLLGYNVEYYSLEMDKEYLIARTVSILTGIPTDDIILDINSKRIQKIIHELYERYPNRGVLNINHYTRDTLTMGILAHDLTMNSKEGRPTDTVIIDYLDLMKSDRQYREYRHEVGHNAISLRALGEEFGCSMWSPSQMNRGTFSDKKKIKDRRNISEDYSKVYTCDYLLNLTEFTEEKKEIGKAQKQIELVRLFVDKNRFGRRGMTMILKPDKTTGRFYNVFPALPKAA